MKTTYRRRETTLRSKVNIASALAWATILGLSAVIVLVLLMM
jgi:hypothetical protein